MTPVKWPASDQRSPPPVLHIAREAVDQRLCMTESLLSDSHVTTACQPVPSVSAMAGGGQRTGTKGRVVLGLVAAILFVAAGFAAISLFGTGSELMKSLSPTESAHEAARRVNTVVATGDLADP